MNTRTKRIKKELMFRKNCFCKVDYSNRSITICKNCPISSNLDGYSIQIEPEDRIGNR